MPTEQEVESFLDEYCEVCVCVRNTVETLLAVPRSAAASSLGIDEYGLDKKFASNCMEARIKTLQEKARLVNQQHQASQQQTVSGLQGASLCRGCDHR